MIGLTRATGADLPFIMETERLPGYDAFIGRSDEAQHRARLADPSAAHFIGRLDGRAVGFAILRDWNAANGVTLLMRIAMAAPGLGHGKAFLRALIDRVFTETNCHRFWLGQFPDNARARHVYEAVGFTAEGVARGNVFLCGRHHDELILSILRPEWQASRSA
jgi:RimJ/RimL family protein N-acetyltransferase